MPPSLALWTRLLQSGHTSQQDHLTVGNVESWQYDSHCKISSHWWRLVWYSMDQNLKLGSQAIQLIMQAWPVDSIFGFRLTFIQTQMSFMYKVKCSLMFLVGNNNTGALQGYPIFHCQLFPEGPIGLNLVWNSSDGTWLSTHDCVLE